MTGFARVRKQIAHGEVVLSLKSVNHRGLDLHFHLPNELDPLESDLRAILKGGVARGHVQIHVSISRTGDGAVAQSNRPLMHAYMAAFKEASELYDLAGDPDLNAALRLPGMLSVEAEADLAADVKDAVLSAASEALVALNEGRQREGAATAAELRQRCEAIRDLTRRIEEIR